MSKRWILGWAVLSVVTCSLCGEPAPKEASPDAQTKRPQAPEAQADPAPAQPKPPARPEIPLPERLARIAQTCLRACASGGASENQAMEALLGLHEPICRQILSADPAEHSETQLRLAETLRRMTRQARIRRIEIKLPPDMRKKFQAFRLRFPVVFDDLMDPDIDRRVAALKRLKTLPDPEKLGASMVSICLYHPSGKIIEAAIDVANHGHYDDDFVVDALVRVVRAYSDWDASWYDDETQKLGVAALEVLANFKSKRASAPLLEMLMQGHGNGFARLRLIEALGAGQDLRVVPHLTKYLAHTQINSTHTRRDIKITRAPCDRALLTLILLTGSHFPTYRVSVWESEHGWAVYGFSSDKDRKWAIAKFKKWHQANKDAIAKLPPLTSSDAPGQEEARDKPSEGVELPDLQGLDATIAEYCTQRIELLDADRYRTRRDAANQILALHTALADALTRQALESGDGTRTLATDVLGAIVAEARLASVIVKADKGRRAKLLSLLEENDRMRRGFYSLRWYQRVESLQWLAKDAKRAQSGAKILQDALSDSNPLIQNAAITALIEGEVSSPELVTFAGDLMIRRLGEPEHEAGHRILSSEDSSSLDLKLIQYVGGQKNRKSLRLLLGALDILDGGFSRRTESRLVYKYLGESGDKALVPVLITRLTKTNWTSGRSDGEMRIEMCEADFALRALLQITGQDPKDYGLIFLRASLGWTGEDLGLKQFGFRDDKARKKARIKFKTWWQEHKNDKAYKEAEPIEWARFPDAREDDDFVVEVFEVK